MENKRDLILRATEQIIANEGLHALSMQKVAAQAGVAAGTIYRYFLDKDQLIDELMRDVLRGIAAIIQVGSDQGTLEQRFKTIWLNIIKLGIQNCEQHLQLGQYFHLTRRISEADRLFEQETFHFLEQLFDDGKAQGVFPNINNDLLFAIGFEAAVGLCRRMKQTDLRYSDEEFNITCHRCWQALSSTNV